MSDEELKEVKLFLDQLEGRLTQLEMYEIANWKDVLALMKATWWIMNYIYKKEKGAKHGSYVNMD